MFKRRNMVIYICFFLTIAAIAVGYIIFMIKASVYGWTRPALIISIVVSVATISTCIALTVYFKRLPAAVDEALLTTAQTDDLTGILNEKGFEMKSERILGEVDARFTVLTFDIYSFKSINDLIGRAAGDTLLRRIAEIIEAESHENETAARIFGDHFVWLMCGRSETEIISVISRVSERIQNLQKDISLLLRFGYYTVEDRAEPVKTMIDRAESARHSVNGVFPNNVRAYDFEMYRTELEDGKITTEIENAIAADNFVMFLQPKYSSDGSRIVGAEALARWFEHGKVKFMPGRFIPLFEKNGMITKLDDIILEKACRFQREALDSGIEPPPIAVNFSRAHLSENSFIEKVLAILKKYDLPTKYIEVEFTESSILENHQRMLEILSALHDEGFSVAMDDFGSGYSSLNMLRTIPVDVIKLDKELVDSVDTDERGRMIVSGMLSIARKLKLVTVVEGVETKGQYDILRDMKCDIIQGYYFSKPIPVASYLELLRKR